MTRELHNAIVPYLTCEECNSHFVGKDSGSENLIHVPKVLQGAFGNSGK